MSLRPSTRLSFTTLVLVTSLVTALCTGCSGAPASPFPYDDYEYELNNLTLGVNFPPDSDEDYRQFTLYHLTTLDIPSVRISRNWSLREPVNGTFYWKPMDDRMDFYAANGIEVLLTLDTKEFPDWTVGMSNSKITMEYRQYVDALLDRYQGKITIIQVGNEWNWEIDNYLDGNEDLFIAMNEALADAIAAMPEGDRPRLALGSISIGGLRALAYNQHLIDTILFDGIPLYTESELAAAADNIAAVVARSARIFDECTYDLLDIHLYDDYWNWPSYLAAVESILIDAGKDPEDYPVIVGEFGGPEPDLEPADQQFLADRLVSYINTLDGMRVEQAWFFKLVENATDLVVHPDSYLISSELIITPAYEVLRRFGESD